MSDNLVQSMQKLNLLKVAVIGDYCLDQYWYLDEELDQQLDYSDKVSFGVKNTMFYPGAAGNVASNFMGLGVHVKCIGVIGDDGHGYELKKCLKSLGADTDSFVISKARITHTYTRPIRIVDGKKLSMNEIASINFVDISLEEQNNFLESITSCIEEVDAVVLVEQDNNGLFTDSIREKLISLSKIYSNKIFIVDSRKYVNKYENFYLKCNQHELADIVNYKSLDIDGYDELSKLMHRTFGEHKGFFITRGENGILVADSKHNFKNVETVKNNDVAINTCGAGDSATVGIVIGLLLGYCLEKSALLGNIIASITIKNLDTTGFATIQDVYDTLKMINSVEEQLKYEYTVLSTSF